MVFLQKVMRLGWQAQFRDELILMATYLVTALRTCPPRTISVSDCRVPVMIYTDGAYEPEQGRFTGSAGLVIVDFATGFKVVQVIEVSNELPEHWGRNGSKQFSFYLELWPALVTLRSYGMRFFGRRAILYIDNNAVRDALIKGSSPNVDMFSMLALCSLQIAKHCLHAWFTRIASASNPADAPSGNQAVEMADKLGACTGQPISVPSDLSSALLAKRSFVEFMKQLE